MIMGLHERTKEAKVRRAHFSPKRKDVQAFQGKWYLSFALNRQTHRREGRHSRWKKRLGRKQEPPRVL